METVTEQQVASLNKQVAVWRAAHPDIELLSRDEIATLKREIAVARQGKSRNLRQGTGA